MKPIIKCIVLCVVILFSGCTMKKQMRIDIDTYINNQASYINKEVIIKATLEDIVSRYSLYLGKRIEISAPLTYFGSKKFWTWYILLQKDEHTLKCFTHYYRLKAANEAHNLLLRAKSKNEPIRVLGVLFKDGLEIEVFSYDGLYVDPSIYLRQR